MRRTFAPALVLCLFACAETSPPPGVSISDSAGVTIVSVPTERIESLAAWSLSETPVLDIQTDGERGPVLFRVSAVVPLSGGRIAVGNTGPLEVLLFNTQGGFLQSVGGEGQGPDEFGSIQSIVGLPGDSIGVYDFDRRRFSVFSPSGEVVRGFDTRDLNPPGGSSAVLPLPNGELLLFGEGGFGSEVGVHRIPAESFRLSAVGDVLGSMGSFPSGESYVSEAGGMGGVLFGAGTYSTTLGDKLVVGLSDAPEFRIYERSGALIRIVRWVSQGRSVTPEDVARLIEVAAATVPETQREMVRQSFMSFPHSDRTPVYEDLITSDEGDLWVGMYAGPVRIDGVARYAQRKWLVFNGEGVPQATAETPEGFRLHAVRDGWALGVHTDELGVESVRAYALGKE